MTTPRVTVPVKGQSFANEQEWINRASRVLTAHPDYNNTEHGETNGWRGNHFTALCFDQAGNRMRCGADFKRATKEATYPVWWVWPDQIAAMLSAAPAPDAQPVAWRGRISETSSVWDYRDFDMTGELWSAVQPLYTHPAPDALRVAVTDIAAERQRQVDVEGWSEAHDDEHDGYQMARAAGCYAFHASREDDDGDTGMFVSAAVHHGWPWDRAWWKPKSRRADLVRAGALIVAEIERLDRAALQAEQGAK